MLGFRRRTAARSPGSPPGEHQRRPREPWQRRGSSEATIRRHFIFSGYAEGWWTGGHEYIHSRVARGNLTGQEIRALFDEKRFEKVWAGDGKHFTLNLTAASTGLRMGELQALAVGSVQLDYLAVSQSWERRTGLKEGTKTGAGRMVPLPKRTSAQLAAFIESSPCQEPADLVFYSKDRSTPHSPRNMLLRAARVPDPLVHRVTGHRTQEMTEHA